MTVLLDANVLIALVVADHVHHEAAESWFATGDDAFATCPMTQGSLVRLVIRQGQPAETAVGLLSALTTTLVTSSGRTPGRSKRSPCAASSGIDR